MIPLYHGSDKIIKTPSFGAGRPQNDYGRGFYCTQSAEMGKEWAARRLSDGFLNQYAFEEEGLRVLDLDDPVYCILHWLTVLLEHRTFTVRFPLAEEAKVYLTGRFHLPCESYDVIKGYRADDSYFSFAQDFLAGAISVRQLKQAMELGRLGEQIMLRSEEAFRRLSFTGYETVPHAQWYARRQARDRQAREAYFQMERNRRRKDDLYIAQIMDQEIRADDVRLRSFIPQ